MRMLRCTGALPRTQASASNFAPKRLRCACRKALPPSGAILPRARCRISARPWRDALWMRSAPRRWRSSPQIPGSLRRSAASRQKRRAASRRNSSGCSACARPSATLRGTICPPGRRWRCTVSTGRIRWISFRTIPMCCAGRPRIRISARPTPSRRRWAFCTMRTSVCARACCLCCAITCKTDIPACRAIKCARRRPAFCA